MEKQIINDFINSIDNELYTKIRKSNGDAECRRYLKEHLQKQLTIPAVMFSLRDSFAAEAMKAEIISWNTEMSDNHRAKLLEDMIERFGHTTVYEALAKNSYEMADVMIKIRNET